MRDQDTALPDAGTGPARSGARAAGDRPAAAVAPGAFPQDFRAYPLAADTAIGVVRAWTIARPKALNEALADGDPTPLALLGGFLLWVLRLTVAPASTLAGFRAWVLEECPVAPARRVRPSTPAA